MTEVCREFGISRKTGYKIFTRYKDQGLEALTDRSRRPVRYANQLPPQIERQFVTLKQEKPHWGARKIRELLVGRLAAMSVFPPRAPSTPSCTGTGWSKDSASRDRAPPAPRCRSASPPMIFGVRTSRANSLGNGEYCYPLTVTDHASRYLLMCEALDSVREDTAITAFQQLFLERGLPTAIRSDNGVPFASPNALFNLSRVSSAGSPIRSGPITGRIHMPPPSHQTFAGPNFVICSFCPRKLDFDPDAVPIPYHHSNLQSEEMLYYVDGSFSSRKGIEVGSVTLHPSGLPHGPHPGLAEKSLGMTETHEFAVMCDTFHPLRLTAFAAGLDDGKYMFSWAEDPFARRHLYDRRRRNFPLMPLVVDWDGRAPSVDSLVAAVHASATRASTTAGSRRSSAATARRSPPRCGRFARAEPRRRLGRRERRSCGRGSTASSSATGR